MMCITCGRSMRHDRALIRDHPGTVKHSAGGVCAGCYKAARRTKTAVTTAQTESTSHTLAAYLTWRAPFRAKAQGLA